MKLSEYRIGLKFDKKILAVEQNNYWSKIANVYIAYAWPRNPTNNFKFSNCLFGATSIIMINKIVIKKHICIGDMEYHLIVHVFGVLIMALSEMI